MTKITIFSDIDKKDILDQYTWAIKRLDEIINNPLNTNVLLIQAVKDEAKILRKTVILIKKILLHEL